MTEFYFIRHGETTANVLGLKQGMIDNEETFLNNNGKQQAREFREKFDLKIADRFIISPMKRVQQTTEILNVELQLPVSVDDRLREISYGSWDGKSNKELRSKYPDVFDQSLNDVTGDYVKYAKDGETFEEVVQRVGDFLAETSQEYPEDKFIVISHGFTIKAAVINVLGLKDMMTIPEPENLRVNLIRIVDRHAYLIYYNR